MTASKGARGGQGYSFNGAKARDLASRLSALRRTNEQRRWGDAEIDVLSEHIANGIDFSGVAILMERPQDEVERAFDRLRSTHPQFC